MEISLEAQLGPKTLTIETGKVAKQASGAALVRYGETTVLVTVVATPEERQSDFLPLTVEYQEKIYAAGRIPGNYFRREIGRPSEKETLTARLIDRPIGGYRAAPGDRIAEDDQQQPARRQHSRDGGEAGRQRSLEVEGGLKPVLSIISNERPRP